MKHAKRSRLKYILITGFYKYSTDEKMVLKNRQTLLSTSKIDQTYLHNQSNH